EWAVVDRLAGLGIVAVTRGLELQRPDHLRVAVVATFAYIDVAARQLQRRVWNHSGQWLDGLCLVHQWHDLGEAAEGHGHSDQHRHQADILFDLFVSVVHRRGLRPGPRPDPA